VPERRNKILCPSRDTINLSKHNRQVTVNGEVERPGSYQLLAGENLEKAIMSYGSGPTAAADLSRWSCVKTIAEKNRRDQVR